MNILKATQKISLILVCFFLPLNLNLNNIFLVIFILISCALFFLEGRNKISHTLKSVFGIVIILSLPFLINFFGLTYTKNLDLAIDYNVRALPFFLLPIIALSENLFLEKHFKVFALALIFGCLTTAVISWTWVGYDIFQSERSISDIIGPHYTHHRAVKILDLHAAYLSICIYTVIAFIVKFYTSFPRQLKRILLVIALALAIFMIQLLSRNALIFSIISGIFFLIRAQKWKFLSVGLFVLFVLGVTANGVKHNYLRDRLFKSFNFFESSKHFGKKDDRFDRLSASYEIFLKSPIFGYGTASEDPLRLEVFKRNNDLIGYEKNYNAHNQFFEYLSTFGIFGGLVFLLFFSALFYMTIKLRNGILFFLVLGLFCACLTESIFERSQGVVYSALLSSAVVVHYYRSLANKLNAIN